MRGRVVFEIEERKREGSRGCCECSIEEKKRVFAFIKEKEKYQKIKNGS